MTEQDKKASEEKEEKKSEEETEETPKKEEKKTYTATLSFGKALDKMVKKKEKDEN